MNLIPLCTSAARRRVNWDMIPVIPWFL